MNDVRQRFEEQNKVYIIVSEGIRDKDGRFISEFDCVSQDKFGHVQLGGVSEYLRRLILDAGFTTRVKALQLGVLQRCAMHCASDTDLTEAYNAGKMALQYASQGESGKWLALTGYLMSLMKLITH